MDDHGAHADIRSLVPPTLRLGSGAATAALAGVLAPGERPVSLVSGHREGAALGERTHVLLITDSGVAVADLRGRAAQRWSWSEVESFSTRNSNPASYALDFVTLG